MWIMIVRNNLGFRGRYGNGARTTMVPLIYARPPRPYGRRKTQGWRDREDLAYLATLRPPALWVEQALFDKVGRPIV